MLLYQINNGGVSFSDTLISSMDDSNLRFQLEAVVPGVFDAYDSLKSHDGMGLHTSSGSFYNHTLFGRDGSMAAKFVTGFDYDVAVETIVALTALQGTKYDTRTQEEPGRIHHELRDFHTWKGKLSERLFFWLLHSAWSIHDYRLLSYFGIDETALYVRLVHKYVKHDAAILLKRVTNHHGEVVTVAESLVAAARWIISKLDNDGLLVEGRSNRTSIPFQTFQDSVTAYARSDGSLADAKGNMSYVEIQAFAADALNDMVEMFPGHELAGEWKDAALRVQGALFDKFWQPQEAFFASSIDSKGVIDTRNISAGWTLNTLLWEVLDSQTQAEYISPIVQRLFSDEFLTSVGLRTKSKDQPSPIVEVIGYHCAEVVWPMFTFMVVEGLRRHRLYNLAQQLENRILNGLNAIGNFNEFFIVLRDGTVVIPDIKGADGKINVQMPPEKRIAFSVVPAIVLAWRAGRKDDLPEPNEWQRDLETKIMKQIDHVERYEPDKAIDGIGPVKRMRLRRWAGLLITAKYLVRERKKLL